MRVVIHIIKSRLGKIMNILKKSALIVLCASFLIDLSCSTYDDLAQYRYNAYVRAFLDAIAFAEGTNTAYGYRMQYPGVTFDTFDDHPRTVLCAMHNGKPLCATAAGRYMFLQRTWDRLAPKIKARDFGPHNQDKAAIALLYEKKALPDIMAGKFENAVKKVNTVWATLPGAPYGQTTKTMQELERVFRQRLAYYKSR